MKKFKERFRDNRRKLMNKIFTWEFILIFWIVMAASFLMTGCASYVSATVGDHTVRTGFHISHEATTDD